MAHYRAGRDVWVAERVRGPEARSGHPENIAWVGKEAWVVGLGGLILHRTPGADGASWRLVNGPTSARLRDVAGSAPDAVFTVGYQEPGPERVALRWNGERWRRTSTGSAGWYTSVAVLADGTPYAAGQRFDRAAISRYDELDP